MMNIKKLWSRFLVWVGLRKKPIEETPIDRSFVIMGLGDLRKDWCETGNKILPSDNKNRMFPNKDHSYIGQTIPNPWQPEAKLKHSYYNTKTFAVRYFDDPPKEPEWILSTDYNPFHFKFDYTIDELKSMKEERDKSDILVRLEWAKSYHQNVEVLEAAIKEIKLLRQGKCSQHDPVKNGGKI